MTRFTDRITQYSRRLAGPAILAAMTLAGGQAATAQTLRIAQGLPETFTGQKGLEHFAEAIEAATGIEAKVYAMSLLTLAETPGGVRDGIADAGLVLFPYAPAEFSEVNLIANLSMLSTIGEQVDLPGGAMVGATMEYVMLNCPSCLAQMDAMNQVFIGGGSTTPYMMSCTTPITTAEDLKGKKIRAGAGNFGRWAEHFGATQVAMPGNEIYDGLSTGIIDCNTSAVAEIVGLRHIDVISSVTLGVPGGVFSGSGTANFNKDVWSGFTTEQRRTILDLAADLAAENVLAYYHEDAAAIEAAKEKGLTIIEAGPDLTEATEAFVLADIAVVKEQFSSKFGLSDVDAKVETIIALVEKWKGLAVGAGTNQQAWATLYRDEILSKLDAATYGVK